MRVRGFTEREFCGRVSEWRGGFVFFFFFLFEGVVGWVSERAVGSVGLGFRGVGFLSRLGRVVRV